MSSHIETGGLKKVKRYPLSDTDLRQLLGSDINILTYPQLSECMTIDDLFDARGRCMILYLIDDETSGHWCCLIKRPKRIDFFNSYGDSPAETKLDIPRDALTALNEDAPILTHLLRNCGLPIYSNNIAFQKMGSDIATCGRHCAVRLLNVNKSLKQYKSLIDKSGMSADDYVCAITFDKIKK